MTDAPTPRSRPGRRFPIVPAILFLALWLGGSILVVGSFLIAQIPGGWATLLALVGLVAIPIVCLVRGLTGSFYPSAPVRLLIFRPFWYGMLFAPVLAVAASLGALVGRLVGPEGAGGAFGRWALGILAGLVVVAAILGYLDSRRLVLRQLEVRLPRLGAALDGLRIVQISDLHVGPHTSTAFLGRVARTVAEQDPDLIAITGDQVDDFTRDVEIFNRFFAALEAPLGRFVIAGNHDVFAGWKEVERGLEAGGFEVLVNRAQAVERGGDRLWVAGTGDPTARIWPWGGGVEAIPDIDRTLRDVLPGEPVLALAHNPSLWPALAARGVDLTLSGHTHYGQLAIPRLGWSLASAFLELAMGTHRRGESLLYIHPGTNYWGIPFRLGTPPEVAVLTLRTSDGGKATIVG